MDLLFITLGIYFAGLIATLGAIPILKGYHLQKYKNEWDTLNSKFKYLPSIDFYVAFCCVFWPAFIVYLTFLFPVKYVALNLSKIGKLIAEKEMSLPKLESKRDERRRELVEAELEVEKFLMSGK